MPSWSDCWKCYENQACSTRERFSESPRLARQLTDTVQPLTARIAQSIVRRKTSRTHFNPGASMKRSTRFLLLAFLVVHAARLQGASTLQLLSTTLTVPENWGDAVLTVQRLGDLDTVVSADYATTNGTAIAGSDYEPTAGTVTFKAGQTNQTIRLAILNDALPEPAKTFQVSLSNPSAGAVLGANTKVSVVIRDNDAGIQLELLRYSVNEDAGSVRVAVTRGSDEDFAASIDYGTGNLSATAGSDYVETKGTLN